MKKLTAILLILLLCIALAACGKSEFGLSENDGRLMTITAGNADKDAFFMSGSLEADEGDEIVISASLKKGTVRIEIVSAPEEQSIDELPNMDGEAVITANASGSDMISGTVPAGSYMIRATSLEKATGTIRIEVKASEAASGSPSVAPEVADAYRTVMDELAEHLGYDEAEASEGECLHGGFLSDWDGDGTPELCLLLKTSPRDPEGWEGTPLYGWYAPTLYLYTVQNGQAVRAGECDLYFSTAGREGAVAVLAEEKGMKCFTWDHYSIEGISYAGCFELINGQAQKTDLPADLADAAEAAETVQQFLDALGADRAQLLLYNSSGKAGIAAEQNARELRDALAGYAA